MPSKTSRDTASAICSGLSLPSCRYHCVIEFPIPKISRVSRPASTPESICPAAAACLDQGRDLAIETPPPRHRLPLGRRVALDPLEQLDLLHELERDDHAAVDDMPQALQRRPVSRARFLEHAEQPFEAALQRARQQFLLA